MAYPAHTPSGESISYEAPHYAIFSNLLLRMFHPASYPIGTVGDLPGCKAAGV
jgi:hypothetical protein